MLSVVPILVCLLELKVAPRGFLSEHILCLTILAKILGLFKLGSEKSVPHLETLARLIRMHAELFVELYPEAAKPKFHAQFHIYENIVWLGKLLSCFVTERKHKITKTRCFIRVQGYGTHSDCRRRQSIVHSHAGRSNVI